MSHKFCFDGEVQGADLEKTADGYQVVVNGKTYSVALDYLAEGELRVQVDGRPLTFYWASDGPLRWVWLDGKSYLLDTRTSLAKGGAGAQQADNTLRAPMPGQVIGIPVQAGEAVARGQTLILLEAMKMEIRIQAPSEGEVARLLVGAGETVDRDQPLVELIY
jgi:acetyl/propionyl-CoA carboxylase alpha subunit